MKYEVDAALCEIIQRKKKLMLKREQLRFHFLSASSVAVSLAFITAITILGRVEQATSMYSPYGAFLISPQTGGYILVSVLAFSAGVTITLLAKHHKKK